MAYGPVNVPGAGTDISELTELVEAKADASVTATGTLSASSWSSATDSDGTTYYTQTLSFSAVTSDSNGIFGLGQGLTSEQYTAAIAAGLTVYSQADGTLAIAAYGTMPSVSIPVVVTIIY